MTSEHLSRLLREALSAAPGESPASQFTRQAVLAAARRDPTLAVVADQMSSAQRAELQLHLEGSGVDGNETSATALGRFATRMAETVKEFVKSDFGLGRWSNRLQIGSLAPGSASPARR